MSVKVHSRLGASGAKRWMTCPGSIALSEGLPDVSSIFAEEGDRAHDLAELCLTQGTDPEQYIGRDINGVKVSDEMAFHIAVYVKACREFIGGDWQSWVEKQFSLDPLDPPEPMFGTSDFTAYNAALQHLRVIDLKYGQGIVVEIADNPQTLYYALGVALDLHPLPITTITLTIVQPRVGHPDGIVRSVEIGYLELIEFAKVLLEKARATEDPNAPLVPGEHCRFCPASGRCPAQYAQAVEIAQVDFAVEESIPPVPSTMPMDMVAGMLPKLDVLEDWIKAMRAHALAALERGDEVPGYKLVPKRAYRKWSDPAGAALLLEQSDLSPEEIYEPRQLRSVPQIEAAMGKKAFKNSELVQIVVKESSGYKMAPNSNPAPAVVVTAGAEFLALPAGDNTQDKQDGEKQSHG